jgi:hypothetical protein
MGHVECRMDNDLVLSQYEVVILNFKPELML